MKRRLELAAQGEREIVPEPRIVQPQRQREALKPRVYQEARSIADTVINRLKLRHQGGDLIRHFPGKGPSNSSILIALASGCQNKVMNVSKGERDNASLDQLRAAIDASPDIVDQLTMLVRKHMERQHGEEEIAAEES
jgi:hypothetical protein